MDSRFINTNPYSSCDCKSDNEKSNGDDKRSSEYSFVSALSMSGGDGDNSYSTNFLLQRKVLSMAMPMCDGKSETEMNKGGQEGSQYPFVSILSMTGGYGHNSYSTNSLLQTGPGLSMTKPILVKNTKEMMRNLDFPECIKVADLGCSSGQNTFMVMSDIVNTINTLCDEEESSKYPFVSILSMSGGDGHKMSVYLTSSSPLSEHKAYLNQFQTDFMTFLRMRSEEMVSSGHMVLTLIGRKTLDDPLHRDCCHWLTLLSDSLCDLVFEALVSASKVSSFKVPFYDPNGEEYIEDEGSFMVNDLETHIFDLGLSNEEYGLQ
ncbi:unnamed protein product, partial [Brassica oleracea]